VAGRRGPYSPGGGAVGCDSVPAWGGLGAGGGVGDSVVGGAWPSPVGGAGVPPVVSGVLGAGVVAGGVLGGGSLVAAVGSTVVSVVT
jgi:hypothetical protein